MSTTTPLTGDRLRAKAPAPSSAARTASPLDALDACLRDESGLLGDTSRVVDWLRLRRDGLLHVVGLTGSQSGATAQAFREHATHAGALLLDDVDGRKHRIEFRWIPNDSAAYLHDVAVEVVDSASLGSQAIHPDRPIRLSLNALGQLVLEGPPLSGQEPLARGLTTLLRQTSCSTRNLASTADTAIGIATSLQMHAQWLQRAHAARREVLGRLLNRSGGVAQDRAASDALRAELADALQLLDRALRERCRRTLANEGGVQARMAAEVEKVCDTDLARETARKAVNISLRRELFIDLQRAMREHVEQDLHSMVGEANGALADLDALVGRSLRSCVGTAVVGSIPRWHVAPLLDRVVDAMQFNVRYHGTLPRRGFLHRLSEGRKSIFTVLMFTSLFGSFLGFNWRTHPMLGGLFMLGFLCAVAWTYRSWKDEDRERLEEELEKAREQLRMEARRILGDVYRELQAAWAESIEAARRSGIGLIDDALRTASARCLRDGQVQREAVQASLRQIEARELSLTGWRQRLGRCEADLLALRAREGT